MTSPTMNPDRGYWHTLAATTKLPSLMWGDGRETSATSDATTALITPRDGSVLTHVAAASAADVDHAVGVAAHAFSAGPWPRMSPRERGDVLIRWAELVEEHRDELALLTSLEMGKPISDAWQIELRTAMNLLRWYGEIADKPLDESPRGRPDSVALVTREPLGVIAAITPWNFPLTLSLFKIPAALVSGNTLILKPASQSPLSALRLAKLGTDAGLPDGVFQVLTGSGAVAGTALAGHHDVAALTFTGSTDIEIANNSPFGLGSAVWTADLTRAHRVAHGLRNGLVWVNCFEEGDASVPFEGRKLSGHGADKSAHGIDKFTALKTTWIQL